MLSKTALMFFLAFGGGCLATIFKSPFWGVLVYEFQYFLNPASRWWYANLPDFRYSLIIVFLMVVGFFLRSEEFQENRLMAVPQTKWLAAMTVAVLAASFWAVDRDIHHYLATQYIKFLVFIFLTYKLVSSPRQLELTLGMYLVGLFYISFVGWEAGRTGGGRLEGIGGPDCKMANEAGAVLASGVPLLVFYILYGVKRWIQGMALVGLTFVLNCLILINSRGAFLGTVASGSYFVFFTLREKGSWKPKIKILLGLVGGVCIFLYLADQTFWDRMASLHQPEMEGMPDRRMEYWWVTFKMLADHPLGLGGRGYHLLSALYLPSEWLTEGQRAVHSLWFEVLSEYGYHGLFFFLGFVGSNFFLMRKVRKYLQAKNDSYHVLQSVALDAAFFAFLIAATFLNRFYGEMLYWLPAFIAVFANIYMIKPQLSEKACVPKKLSSCTEAT